MTALLKEGRDLISAGKIADARLVLQRAAEAGSAPAALELGGTYDPNVIEGLKVVAESGASRRVVSRSVKIISPDVNMARIWYEKAKDLGSIEASARLERLVNRDGQAR